VADPQDTPNILNPEEPSMAEVGDKVVAGETPPETPPESPPAGETPPAEPKTYSEEEYGAVQSQVEGFSTMAQLLKDAGVTSVEALKSRLAAPTTDSLKELFQDALGQKPPAEPATTPPPAGTLTPESVAEMIGQAMAAQEQQRADRAFQDAMSAEAALKQRIFNDPRFAAVTQKGGYDQAWKGEKGRAAKTLAVLADHLLYERGLKSPDGTYHPVTDSAAVSEITEELAAFLNELKAVTLHEISRDATGIEPPDAPVSAEGAAPPGATPSPEDMLAALWDDDSLLEGDEEAAKRSKAAKAAIAKTFETSYRKAAAAGGQLPLSQME
jgi:hypothetical protein